MFFSKHQNSRMMILTATLLVLTPITASGAAHRSASVPSACIKEDATSPMPASAKAIAPLLPALGGGCSLESLALSSGKTIQIVKFSTGEAYFLPELRISKPHLNIVQVIDDETPGKVTEYGELALQFELTPESQADLDEARKFFDGLEPITEAEDARLSVRSRLSRDAVAPGTLVQPDSPELYRTIPLATGAATKFRVDRDLVSILRTPNQAMSPLELITPRILLDGACGDLMKEREVAAAQLRLPTSEELTTGGKTWAHRRVPYSRDVFNQYWKLKERQEQLTADQLEERRLLHEQAMRLLIENPSQQLQAVLRDFQLSKEEALKIMLDEARANERFDIQYLHDDPIAEPLSMSGAAREHLFSRTEELHGKVSEAHSAGKASRRLIERANHEGQVAEKRLNHAMESLVEGSANEGNFEIYIVNEGGPDSIQETDPTLPE